MLESFHDGKEQKLHDIVGLSDKQQVAVKKFSVAFQKAFATAEGIDGIKEKKKEVDGKKKNEIDKKKNFVDKKTYTQSLSHLEDVLTCDGTAADEKLLFPKAMADKKVCSQPFLLATLRALGSVLNEEEMFDSPVNAFTLSIT